MQRVEGMYFFGLKMVSRGDEGKVMTHRRGRGDARKNILETPGACQGEWTLGPRCAPRSRDQAELRVQQGRGV